MTEHDLLFEIGVEELPASFVAGALAALPDLARARLAELRLAHGEIRALGTPRRLALVVLGLADRQADLAEDLTGPPVSAAYDKAGNPTRAAEAFAKKLGCELAELRRVETPKGVYLAGTRKETGRATRELLGPALASLAAAIPFRKSMRWADGDATFGRPVQWLVALYGDDVVDTSFAGVASGRVSRGHRFLGAPAVPIASAATYLDALAREHVLVDPAARAGRMKERLAAAAVAAGGTLIEDEFLVGENLSLVEEPHVVVGGFEPAFLALPDAVILEVARGHQRYFGVRGAGGELLPRYLAVVNTAENEANVRRGNDRVMRARLADARFFWTEDGKAPLAARRDKLAGIVFQNRLGHMLAKVLRVERLVAALGEALRLDARTRETALDGARLAKCDLVSLMVGEFPELQGVMGRAYALAQGERAEVADVIRDHYAPKGASDATAPTDEAALVALADRLDTLVGCFAVGLSPTGAADPFALRRAALGILRTLLDRGFDLTLSHAVELAYTGLEGIRLDLDATALSAKLADFLRDRLRGLLTAQHPADVVDACLAAGADRPVEVRARVAALAGLDPAVRARAGEVFKRASNIAKDAPSGAPERPSSVQPSPPPAEEALFEAYERLGVGLGAAAASATWADAFALIADFAPVLQRFFEEVFVMVEDAKVRDARLRLMRAIGETCGAVAHFQLLAPQA